MVKRKYKKKPVVIEAFQWYGEEVQGFEVSTIELNNYGLLKFEPIKHLMIPTLEGVMLANIGDWIITGVEGEVYPCKASIFEKTYEPVEEE